MSQGSSLAGASATRKTLCAAINRRRARRARELKRLATDAALHVGKINIGFASYAGPELSGKRLRFIGPSMILAAINHLVRTKMH
jgi:hypothetical protein